MQPAATSKSVPPLPETVSRSDTPWVWLAYADKSLGFIVETFAAILVLAEVCILFAGIAARYVWHSPLIWSNELASTLFLWLAVMGAIIAMRRGEHMRMALFVNKSSPGRRAVMESVAGIAALVFLCILQSPAYEYAVEQSYITSSAMEISDAWRSAALPVGTAFMIAFSIIRLLTAGNWRALLYAAIGVGAIVSALLLAQPVLETLGNANLLIFFVVIVGACVFGGIPIAFSFGLATLGYLSLTTSMPLMVVVGRMDEGMSHLILLAVPLFVLLGMLIEMTGMAYRMVAFLANLLGHVKGGLSYVLIGAMYVVSGISGAKAADMAAIAPVLLPEMRARGADEGETVALLSATGAQTETVPPSLVLITIGSVTGVSISALFTGGLLPSLLLGLMLCVVVGYRCRRAGNQEKCAPRATRKQIWASLVIALPALALPFIIRATVVEGIATATEVSTIGIVYAVVVGILVYRCFDIRRVYPMLVDTACLSGAILLILGTATGMAWALTQSGFSGALAQFMQDLPGGAFTFMLVSIVVFIVLGSVLEGIPVIVLLGPLMFPIAHMLGIHEVHYAMVVILSMGIGLFAPPFGVGYYTACAIARVDPDKGMRPMVGYLVCITLGTLIVAAVPWISIGFLH
ncbi:TRAP transporter large permease subunit [Kerstersia gyiorum]|uniref:TRAP transporter large permease n=1 Tax=Kerstersia gyiorum TaxID=206506 RepID=UPI00209F1476|nr:TRAP transporter large permease subunit [Kerstersia gyiorum]